MLPKTYYLDVKNACMLFWSNQRTKVDRNSTPPWLTHFLCFSPSHFFLMWTTFFIFFMVFTVYWMSLESDQKKRDQRRSIKRKTLIRPKTQTRKEAMFATLLPAFFSPTSSSSSCSSCFSSFGWIPKNHNHGLSIEARVPIQETWDWKCMRLLFFTRLLKVHHTLFCRYHHFTSVSRFSSNLM